MKRIFYALMILVFVANTASAQYCSPTFTNGCFSWRNQNIVVGSINWALGSTSCTISDYTSLSTTVTAGETLPMTVTNGNWCGSGVWVDFNSDFAFDDSENLFHAYQGASIATYNFNITIPANVAAGSYRMRVIAGWGTDTFDSASTNGYGACGTYQYGSFQDFTLQVLPPDLCNTAGNVVVYANYDGGQLTINVDQDIPNLKIGVCTYEACTVVITGAYASNVSEVLYAGYEGDNDHCNLGIFESTISAPAGVESNVLFAPPGVLTDANGNANIICGYSCGSDYQGGCNTADQIVAYFLNQFGGTLYYYYTQYGCWPSGGLTLGAGGNCCPSQQPTEPTAAIDVSDTQICVGDCIIVNDASAGEPTSWNWQFNGTTGPAASQNPGEICYDQPGSYTITLTASNAQGASTISETIEVTACEVPGCMYPNASNYNPAATVDDLSCQFPCAASDCPADLDDNGFVGVSDLLLFIADYGTTCPN